MTDRLFDPGPVVGADPRADPERLSATARRTARQRQLLARGVHPATRRPLRLLGGTCGQCAHHGAFAYSRTYHKCRLAGVSSCAASDIRISWPACELFVEKGAPDG
jgi:hypothetical protein